MRSKSHLPSIHKQNCWTPHVASSVIFSQSAVHCEISGGHVHSGVASHVA